MKPKTVAKMFVDLSMFVLYLLLTFTYENNTLFHEIAGIAIGGLFLLHIILNWKPTTNMVRKATAGKLDAGRRTQLIEDSVLFVSMIVCIGSGMMIAQDLYIGPGDGTFVDIHNIAAYMGLGIMGIHLLTHLKFIVGYFGQAARTSFAQKTTACASAVLVVITLMGSDLYLGTNDSTTSTAIAATTTETGSSSVSDRPQPDTTSSGGTGTTTANASTSTNTESTASASDTSSTSSATQGTTSSATTNTNTVTCCTLCHKNCPITALQCGKGKSWATANGYL